MIKVTVFCEYAEFHKTYPDAISAYPNGIHSCLGEIFSDAGFETTIIPYSEGDDGSLLTDEILQETDVLVWWGHILHEQISELVVEKVCAHVYAGMGCIFLHSAHMAKPFKRLMGTTCSLSWREIGEKEKLWVVSPNHPITQGISECIEIDHEEMYGEFFDIPKPEELIFLGWFQGGEVFRSGATYTRGNGKIFYFQPGHETNQTYRNKKIKQILINSIYWAKAEKRAIPECRHVPKTLGEI